MRWYKAWRQGWCWVSVLALAVGAAGAARAQGNAPLMLYGGAGHQTFLGCLQCGFDPASVCNKHGQYGSRFAGGSIWNKLDQYGSRYSDHSPWSRYASEPPALVDRQGNFQGYLTANAYNPQRTRIAELVALTDQWEKIADDPEAVADRFCGRQ
ncbi:MAG TPA: hypothetical protein VLJ58_14600 [Ramlibacter sp.]|nr:hypothetical protein [Ramlibacter sp.]